MLDWLDVIELGVKLDPDDESLPANESSEMDDPKVKKMDVDKEPEEPDNKLDLSKYQKRTYEGALKLKAEANIHKTTFLPTRYNPYH